MMAYNKINGKYCTENSYLMQDILRGEWGFKGLTVSDWTATADRVRALKAGLDLEMPGAGYYTISKVAKAYRDGEVSAEEIETSARRVLHLLDQSTEGSLGGANVLWDKEADHAYAVELAKKCPVLLKTRATSFPSKTDKVAIIGARAKNPLVQGGGSAHINAYHIDSPYDAFENRGMDLSYAPGYDLSMLDEVNQGLLAEAKAVAEKADKVLLFVSCSDMDVQEGFDHTTMDLPAAMNALVDTVAAVNKNVLILSTGSAVVLPWADSRAILQTYLPVKASAPLSRHWSSVKFPERQAAETYPKAPRDVSPPPRRPQPQLKYREPSSSAIVTYDTAEKEVAYPSATARPTRSSSTTKVVKADDGKVAVCFNIKNVGMKADETP